MTQYISTRGRAEPLSFEDVVLTGLASDGGLYVPQQLPHFSPSEWAAMASLSYTDLAVKIMSPFIGNAIPEDDLRQLIEASYHEFRHPAIAPLKQLRHNDYLLELFHGPTLAFKDFALQFLGRLLEYFITRNNQQLTVIGATSGDTGSAAIAGCRGRKNMRIFILYPHGRVSDVQRRQMTTIADDNVFCLAVEGTFDDCQEIVKSLFADEAFRKQQHLTAVNSINWARILAQTVYYAYAALALGAPAKRISFSVPTGNFGDIFAGYIAHNMGLPIERLIIATNSNDILARCLKTGVYSSGNVMQTASPSMDIQVSSNFERLLFDLYHHNGEAVFELCQDFKTQKEMTLLPSALQTLRRLFSAGSASDAETMATIKHIYQATGELLDPHTAVGVKVGRELHNTDSSVPLVTVATAHPAKFPDAVMKASAIHPPLPPHLAGLMEATERFKIVPKDYATIKALIENTPV